MACVVSQKETGLTWGSVKNLGQDLTIPKISAVPESLVTGPVSPLWIKKGAYKLCHQISPPCHQRIVQADYYLCHCKPSCRYCKCFANFISLYLAVRWVISDFREEESNTVKLTDELSLWLSQIRRPETSGFSYGSEWHHLGSPGTETSRLSKLLPM